MILQCTLVPAPGSRLSGGSLELAVEVPARCSGAELQEAISRRYGTGGLSVNGTPLKGLQVGDPLLGNGAVLVDGAVPVRSGGAAASARTPTLLLAVHSGPGAGTIAALGRGRFRIGRSGTEIVLPDPELSREHALLIVSDSAVTVEDLRSANGTVVDGRRVRRALINTESVIRCGNSSMSLIFGPDSGASRVSGSAGICPAEPLRVRNPAGSFSSPGSRATLLLMASLPLAIGLGLAVFTGMWMFLVFSLASAVTMVLPAVSGRRHRRMLKAALAVAVEQDIERRWRSAPSAAELCARSTCTPVGQPAAGESAAVWLRLGLSEQRANIRLEPEDAGFRAPPLGLLPLLLDPGDAVTAVCGPRDDVAGLVRSFILQLAGYPAASRSRILIHGSAEHLPLAARFLPCVTLSGDPAGTAAHLRAGPGPGCTRGVLINLDPGAHRLGILAASQGWQVIQSVRHREPLDEATVVLGGRVGRLARGTNSVSFLPDLVPYPVFDSFCRRLGLAGGRGTAPPAAMATSGGLAGILPLESADIARRWAGSGEVEGLPVPVGTGPNGTVAVDIQRDGPHVLVAGTTGSGKSEFLRTLAAALAASYPPDRINLLFVDFKGGSGLGPLTGLPHCVGMLSDLGLQEVDRTLVSLRAEVRRREELLASAQARDLTEYGSVRRELPGLPHLVLIIDEFRMLVDEAPRALTELMRIAAIGRSLGVHLIMATQRPQGSITADIRANVTSRVALRVQSGMESVDIMDSTLAADIPIASPGRAFLLKGTEAPEEFQTAILTPDPSPTAVRTVTVRSAAEWVCCPPGDEGGSGVQEAAPAQAHEAAVLAELTGRLWTARGGSPPRRPVALSLPGRLPFPGGSPARPAPERAAPVSAVPARAAPVFEAAGTVRLGWLDIPEEQRLAELCWRPEEHGHLGLVGGASGAGDRVLALAVNQLLAAEQEFHLYILDAASTLRGAAASPRVGAFVGLQELRRAARVLERMAAEMTCRLTSAAVPGLPPLVLALCGWGSWVSAFRSGPFARGEDLVQDLIRDGAQAGITVVVAGERELAGARFFPGIPNRVFIPAGSTEEGRLSWPRLPAMEALPGRVAAFGAFAGTSSEAGHVGQLYEAPVPGLGTSPAAPLRVAPFRVEALPRRIGVPDVLTRAGPFARTGGEVAPQPTSVPHERARTRAPLRLCLGVGGDELSAVSLTIPAGGVLAVLGASRSGKTSLLATLPELNASPQAWLRPAAGEDPAEYWARTHDQARTGSLDPQAVLVADDVDLQTEECNRQLLGLNSLGWTVVLTAGFSPPQHRLPLLHLARSHGKGVLICPRTLLDGDLFGVRFELEQNPPAGRAVVISDGQAVAVQLAAASIIGADPPPGTPA